MQTNFSADQLKDARMAEADAILRRCVHCVLCTATCPTFLFLGDERDSPRGRIYLIKDMLESGGKPSPELKTHIDRCLSCLSCMTTCPSGVDYMHLVDFTRTHMARSHPTHTVNGSHEGEPWSQKEKADLLELRLRSLMAGRCRGI